MTDTNINVPVFEAARQALDLEAAARKSTAEAVDAARAEIVEIEAKYVALYGDDSVKENVKGVFKFASDNWGKIMSVATAFGVPIAAADPGAFEGVFGLVKSFFGIE